MKRFLSYILVAFSLVAFASCVSMTKTRKVGKPITVNMPLRDFSNIAAAGSSNIYFTQADSFSVRVVASKEMIDEMDIKVSHSTLTIEPRKDESFLSFIGEGANMNIYVTAPSLSGASLAGSGDFIVDAPFKTTRFKVSLAGSGDVDMKDLDAQSMGVDVAGSGDVNISARRLKQLKTSVAGSGDIDLKVISCDVADLSVAGSGDITLKGAVRQLHKNVAGSGDIRISK